MSEIEQKAPEAEAVTINLHSMFNKQYEKPAVQNPSPAPKREEVREEAEPEKKQVQIDIDDEDEGTSPSKEPKASPETDYKLELEKERKRVKDTQKSFHENTKQLAAYRKAVEKMKEDGSLLEDEARLLLDHTKFEDTPEEKPLFQKWGEIWDKEITYLRKYAPNPKDVDQNIFAFQHFVQTATKEEYDEMISDLSAYEDDPVELTKQMLEIGKQYNEDIYSDIHEVGSIRKLKDKYSAREKELQNKIDLLSKKYDKLKEKYEDYNTDSNLKLPSGGSGSLQKDQSTFDIGKIFAKQYQR